MKILELILFVLSIFTLSSCRNVIVDPNPDNGGLIFADELDPFSDEIFTIYFYADYQKLTDKELKDGIKASGDDVIGITNLNYQYHSITAVNNLITKETKLTSKDVFSIKHVEKTVKIHEIVNHESHLPTDQRIDNRDIYYIDMMKYEKRELNGKETKTASQIQRMPTYVTGFHRAVFNLGRILGGTYPDLSDFKVYKAKKEGKLYVQLEYLTQRLETEDKFQASHRWYYLFNQKLDTVAFFHSENTIFFDDENKPYSYIVTQEICYPSQVNFEIPDLNLFALE